MRIFIFLTDSCTHGRRRADSAVYMYDRHLRGGGLCIVDTVVLPADYVRDTFAEGEEYVFTLNVTNHFNYTSTSPASYSVPKPEPQLLPQIPIPFRSRGHSRVNAVA